MNEIFSEHEFNNMMLEGTKEDEEGGREEEEDINENVPHYMLPNFTSVLPEYANNETEQIKHAFSKGNYQSLTKLPHKILPDSVNQMKQLMIEENRQSKHVSGQEKIVTKNGLFDQFNYVSTRYSLVDDLNRAERLKSNAKIMEIAGKDFICSGQTTKLKFEGAFDGKNDAFVYSSDNYEEMRAEKQREKKILDQKNLHGPFVPSGKCLPLTVLSKRLLPDLIKELHEVIAIDWVDCNFQISPTADDNIAVQFDASTVESERGLVAYMNIFARNHAVVAKYSLKKIVQDWNSKQEDGFIYFVFRPPWAKNRATDTFVTIDFQNSMNTL